MAFTDLVAGDTLPPLFVTVSDAANRRYLRGAGVADPRFDAGVLYPPIAANLTVLCFGQRCAEPVVQTRQRLRSRGLARVGTPLVVRGEVTAAYEKRGRRYVDVRAVVAPEGAPDDVVWESEASFTPAAGFGR